MVRFSLQDVRKTVQRRGGSLSVSLHFLRPGELQGEITQLIEYYERLLGQPQSVFTMDEARAYIGEYRLAHCLVATLSYWYSWQQREWDLVVREKGGNDALLKLGSSAQLRLALYSYVNAHYHGFLSEQSRTVALQEFADQYQLSVSDLEYLLALDSEEEMLLTRVTPTAPSAQEVATLYNQWTFEAALFSASSVRFVIDCTSFSAVDVQRPQDVSNTPVAGVGAIIKRLCYLARLLGVYYDLEYESVPSVSPDVAIAPQFLNLTLYGPQEVTGAPQQYGMRLARLCRLLMGYGMTKATSQGPDRRSGRSQMATGIVETEARIHFLQRSYMFVMDAKLLQLLPAVTEQQRLAGERVGTDSSQVFDSSIEQSFSEAFQSLARGQGVDGWRLEREPEPLLLAKGIFIPDFALTRGARRIYVEILGFWTPAYRERKIQKLQYLRDRDDLLLAIPIEARESFVGIAQDFPIVYYHGQLTISDVLHVLRKRYDDFTMRLAGLDCVQVRQRVLQEGLISERDCYTLLHCYRRSELQQAADHVCTGQDEIVFVPGLGLYHDLWLHQLKQAFLSWLAQKHSVSLAEAIHELRRLGGQWTVTQTREDALFETVLGLWSKVRIQRDSIFDATVELISSDVQSDQAPDGVISASEAEPVKASKKGVRERKTPSTRKRVAPANELVQGDLWG